ncbi:hypothetical protein [Streptomyces sp. NPDC017529]|uniref:hypothetical protein n=1 Tax=Streptomyces sp. NPDC017529 TaxID=3365000 RepID=UPI0037904057
MPQLILGAYLSTPHTGHLGRGPYGELAKAELAEFLRHWTGLHRQALASVRDRIHPTAQIHPTAIIGDDVIIGPHVRVYEFSTVRDGSVLCAGAQVGFNCEVTRCFLGERAVLGHRIGINRTLVGADAHLSASLTIAAISLWNNDLRHPDREITFRVPDGLYRCGTPRFGGVLGDHCQTGRGRPDARRHPARNTEGPHRQRNRKTKTLTSSRSGQLPASSSMGGRQNVEDVGGARGSPPPAPLLLPSRPSLPCLVVTAREQRAKKVRRMRAARA